MFDLCPHVNCCGHADIDCVSCNTGSYCSYRRIRFKDGLEMPKNIKKHLDKFLEGGK